MRRPPPSVQRNVPSAVCSLDTRPVDAGTVVRRIPNFRPRRYHEGAAATAASRSDWEEVLARGAFLVEALPTPVGRFGVVGAFRGRAVLRWPADAAAFSDRGAAFGFVASVVAAFGAVPLDLFFAGFGALDGLLCAAFVPSVSSAFLFPFRAVEGVAFARPPLPGVAAFGPVGRGDFAGTAFVDADGLTDVGDATSLVWAAWRRSSVRGLRDATEGGPSWFARPSRTSSCTKTPCRAKASLVRVIALYAWRAASTACRWRANRSPSAAPSSQHFQRRRASRRWASIGLNEPSTTRRLLGESCSGEPIAGGASPARGRSDLVGVAAPSDSPSSANDSESRDAAASSSSSARNGSFRIAWASSHSSGGTCSFAARRSFSSAALVTSAFSKANNEGGGQLATTGNDCHGARLPMSTI